MVMTGAGLRPIGKPMDAPPYPTIMRALHFYPDSVPLRCDRFSDPYVICKFESGRLLLNLALGVRHALVRRIFG